MYVPEVYMDSKDVMVAERITGVPISGTATFDRLGMNRADCVRKRPHDFLYPSVP